MAKILDKLNKRIARKQSNIKNRKKIMGETGMVRQDMRGAQANMKAAFKKGDSVTKAKGRQAVKRVGEYKAATKKKARIKRMNTPFARAVSQAKKFNP
jgi:hypothetical protein